MSSDDRHINFKLMREWILAHQDEARADRHMSAPLNDETSTAPETPALIGAATSNVPQNGKKFWRSLEELAGTPEFHEFVQREYPQHAEEWDDPIERRTFLKLMGASLALAGLSGCVYQPPEKIVPFVRQPEGSIPGKALFFATAATVCGIATPVLVRSNEGRPTKVEGNPDHPHNRSADSNDRGSSATDIFAQASILGLYDPERSDTVTYRDEIRTWTTFLGEMRTALDEQRPKQGAGLRFLTETITSPTLAAQLKGLLTDFPQAKWHQYEPVNRDNVRAGAMLAFGEPVHTIYNFDQATRILSLDADFLSAMPGTLRYARQFAARRRVTEGKHEMSRLYVVETTPTTTGASADHRWTVKPSALESLARQLAAKCGVASPSATETASPAWTDAVARDLQQQKGASIVIAGNEAPPAVHALAHAMNAALGNVGKTVTYTDPLEANPVDQRESLSQLVQDIDGGRVELLVMLGGNPVYNTPPDLKLDFNRLSKVKLRVHLSSHKDETSELCHWHVPEAHYLESWGDTRTIDGTVSIVQPLIEPLYGSKSAHEVLAVFSEKYDRKAYEIVREYWQGQSASPQTAVGSRQEQRTGAAAGASTTPPPQASPSVTQSATTPSAEFEDRWRQALHDGFMANTALQTKPVTLKAAESNVTTFTAYAPLSQMSAAQTQQTTSPDPGFEIVFRTDPTMFDGRFANNGWLQELPKPLTKITWDNAALISPATAQKLGLANNSGWKGTEVLVGNIQIDNRGKSIICPTWIMPGQPDDVVTLHLGYGRRKAGRFGSNRGFNAYEIRTSDSPWIATGAKVQSAAGQYQLAVTQLHFNMEGRDILRTGTLAEYLQTNPDSGAGHERPQDPGITDQRGNEHGGNDHGKAFGAPSPPTHVPRPEETLYGNEHKYEGYAWGMAIDANSCIGCNACIIACQSENNIAIVGKEQVTRSREMHWLRVDTYYEGQNAASPDGTYFMPVPCMHCENAPCEPVCPVHATVHSAEGINDMVYNRCVGTRYCSNNCPYKVRRFNFLLYQDWDTPTYQLMRNPEVTVRSRGVMEKCTYCIQRIQEAKIGAELEDRPVRDGEIVTACQAVCPTETIVFGDINDPHSRVAKLKAESRNYSLLSDLNTRPRTTYLGALRNPNPEIG